MKNLVKFFCNILNVLLHCTNLLYASRSPLNRVPGYKSGANTFGQNNNNQNANNINNNLLYELPNSDIDIPDEQRLINECLTMYDPAARPVYNSTKVVIINFGLSLIQICDMVN